MNHYKWFRHFLNYLNRKAEGALDDTLIASIQAYQAAFLRTSALADSMLEGTGFNQWKLFDVLAEQITNDVIEECGGEINAIIDGFAENCLKFI